MKVTETALKGLLVIEPQIFADDRGFFVETWNEQRYREAGIDVRFVQDNFSRSVKGTLRGLHFQNPTPQGKLVSVVCGEVYDVAVDIRRSSSTFGRYHGINLADRDKRQVYIPPGFAHGFQVLSDDALFHYKCSGLYNARDELAISWDDPDLAIPWPLSAQAILSEKDRHAPRLRDLPRERLFS